MEHAPVKAAKYHRGMENGFMVYILGIYKGKRHNAMKFFDSEQKGNRYISSNPSQYLVINGKRINITNIEYREQQPVIHTKLAESQKTGYIFFLENALVIYLMKLHQATDSVKG